jgi:hypothetical protein
MSEDIIETLRRIQCSDAACSNLKIAMGVKLAIYEIERLRVERDEARREVCQCRSTSYPHDMKEVYEIADSRGWDCFKEDNK